MAATEPFSVRLTREQAAKVALLAEIEDRSQGSVVRRAVDRLEPPEDVRDSTAAVEDR
jgi:hypothetical protein